MEVDTKDWALELGLNDLSQEIDAPLLDSLDSRDESFELDDLDLDF